MCCLHYAEKQRASNPWYQGPAPNAQRQTNQLGLPQSAERNSRGSGPDRRQERGLWPVPARTRSARPDLGSRALLTRRWRILTIKERASACPGGIASAGRSWTPRRDVCGRCHQLRGARATPKIPACSPGPGARPHGSSPAAAPPLPSRVARSWSVLGEVGAPARREGAGGRVGEGKRLFCADPGGAPRPALQRFLSSALDLEGGESRAQGARAAPLPPAPGAPGVFPLALGARIGVRNWGPGPGYGALIALPKGLGVFVRGARRPGSLEWNT